MPKGSIVAAASRLDVGLAELGEGKWEAARGSFEDALHTHETPEAFEGLSWAAWWLDDADEVFAARQAAYRLYRTKGQAAAAARMAIWLASDHLDFRGALAVAGGWLQRARRLLVPLEAGPEHGWLAFHQGYVAYISGQTAAAREHAVQAAEIGRRFDVPDLQMLGLALEGGVLVSGAQVTEGMRCLDESTATALEGDATVPISTAWAFCFLVSACVAVRDYRRAFEWCDRIAEFASQYQSRYMLGYCRARYGVVYMSRGRWEDAAAELEAAVADLSRSRPAHVADALVWLAELRRRQGRAADALALLERAGSGLAALCRQAQIDLDRGMTLRAAELAERYLRQVPFERSLDRVPALEILVQARIEHGDLDKAAGALNALRAIELRVGTPSLRASVDLVEGMLTAARGDHEGARPLLEDAADAFERSGLPFEGYRAKLELATSLIASGRLDAAEREARSASDGLRQIGAGVEARRAQRILDGCASAGGEDPIAGVTHREREVLALLADGLTNRQIAEGLSVSEHTVHRHVTNILRKLDLPSRTAAAARAIRAGLLNVPSA